MNISLAGIIDVFYHLPHAVAIYDSKDLNIAFVNAEMLKIWNRTDNLTGRNFGEIFPEHVMQGFDELLRKVWLTGKTYTALETRADILIDGQLIKHYFDFEYTALKDQEGQTYAVLHTAKEVSDRMLASKTIADREASEATINKELTALNEQYIVANELLLSSQQTSQKLNKSLQTAYEQIAENEERLNQAISSARIGTWRMDVAQAKVHWDDRTRQLFGFSTEDVVDYYQVITHMHPADKPKVEKAIARALSPKLKEDYDITFRILNDDTSEPTWIHAKGKATFNAKNEPVYFSGIVLDITESKLISERTDAFHKLVARKERKLQLILESAKVGTYTFDVHTSDIKFNNHSHLLFEFITSADGKESEPLEKTLDKYIPLLKKGMQEAIANDVLYDHAVQILDRRSGDTKWLRFVGGSARNTDNGMFYGLIIDITSQKIDEKRKTDFLGIASHELRSPLTALMGYLQILEYKGMTLPPERVAAIVKSAEHQTYRMRTLIDGFLNISHIEEGNLRLNQTVFNISNLLKEIHRTFSDTIKTHDFMLALHDQALEFCADKDKVEQVIINFINNAVKYTPANTEVTLTTKLVDSNLVIQVSDEGPGISEENQTRLFDKFFRVHSANSPQISGFGIGLYISKEIVRLHHGDIGVDSTPGQGSTFWIALPLQPAL